MDRRSFLRTTGAAVAGAAAFADLKTAAGVPRSLAGDVNRIHSFASRNRDNITSTLDPWTPGAGEWNTHTIGHLYRRAGFGAKMSEIKAAASLTPSQLVDQLLDDKWTTDANMPPVPSHSTAWLGKWPYVGSDTTLLKQQNQDYQYADMAIRRNWAATMTNANVMLREKMVYFWMNHFVVEAQKVYYPQMLQNYLNYFRHNPWGNFKQIVRDVSVSPAMLIYLDGAQSSGKNPNENYGRELMELFTLGVTDKNGNPNYTEDDIKGLANALTGFQIQYTDDGSGDPLHMTFNLNRHNNALKTVFEAPPKPYGLNSPKSTFTDDILDVLFQYRGEDLAYFICSELYQFFVYHEIGNAEQAIVQQLADTFKAGNWELKPVLAQLLKSAHFFDDANIGAEIKSPFEFMTGLTRHLDIAVDDLMTGTMETQSAGVMNQSLLDPPNVKGWPGYRSWISTSTLPQRNTFGTDIAGTPTGYPTKGGLGSSGYGETYRRIQWLDAAVLTWAAQFDGFKSDLTTFINNVYTFLSAMPSISDMTVLNGETTYVRTALGTFPDYEWPGMNDTDRTTNIRLIVKTIVALPEFQLM